MFDAVKQSAYKYRDQENKGKPLLLGVENQSSEYQDAPAPYKQSSEPLRSEKPFHDQAAADGMGTANFLGADPNASGNRSAGRSVVGSLPVRRNVNLQAGPGGKSNRKLMQKRTSQLIKTKNVSWVLKSQAQYSSFQKHETGKMLNRSIMVKSMHAIQEVAESGGRQAPRWMQRIYRGIFRYYEYWVLYILLHIGVCILVFDPFDCHDEVACFDCECTCGKIPCDSPINADGKRQLDLDMWFFLWVAKWCAACIYIRIFMLILVYSRVIMGYVQFTVAGLLYVPFIGKHNPTHASWGWTFLWLMILHTMAHVARILIWIHRHDDPFLQEGSIMPKEVWITGWIIFCAFFFVTGLLAFRNWGCSSKNKFCLSTQSRGCSVRKSCSWETMVRYHILGIIVAMIAAFWHKFDTSTFRFFFIFAGALVFFVIQKVLALLWTRQVNCVTHTIQGAVSLIVIRDFPFWKKVPSQGRAWYSADVKIMYPDVNNREWHPFTCIVSAATGDGYILVKNYGDWSGNFTQKPAPFVFMRTPPLVITRTIPPEYRQVLVAASGTFITTVAGTVSRSVDQNVDESQNITIVWSDREPIMIALVVMRILRYIRETKFIVYCTAKDLNIGKHVDHAELIGTKAATLVERARAEDDAYLRDDEEAFEILLSAIENPELKAGQSTKTFGKAGDLLTGDDEKVAPVGNPSLLKQDTGVDKSILDLLKELFDDKEQYGHIEIRGGRPNFGKIMSEMEMKGRRVDYCFGSAAPPVTRALQTEAEKRHIPFKEYKYL